MAQVIRRKRSNQPGRSHSGDAASKRFLLPLPCVIFALACVACNTASTYVPAQHLKTTLAQIHKAEWGEPIPATMDGQPITIGPGHSPIVTISVNDQCERTAQRAHMRASCEPFRRVPYTDVRVEGEVVKVRGDPPAIIPLDGIEVVQVQLQGIDRPSWHHNVGSWRSGWGNWQLWIARRGARLEVAGPGMRSNSYQRGRWRVAWNAASSG